MRSRGGSRRPGLLVGAALALGLAATAARPVLAQDLPIPVPAPAPQAPAPAPARRPDSPRDLFQGFRRVMEEVVTFGRSERLDAAVDLLDLSGIPEAERPARGPDLARALKDVLDFHGRIPEGSLPDAGAVAALRTWTLQTSQGAVSAALVDGRWLFSAETLGRVAVMRNGFLASGAVRTDAFSLRRHVPESLRDRALGLEHWQWLGIVGLALLSWFAHRVVVFIAHLALLAILRRRGWEERSTKAADEASRPLGFFAVAITFVVATPLLGLPRAPVDLDAAALIAAKFFASLGAVLVCYRLADVVGAHLQAAADRTDSRLDDQLVPLVRKSLKILVTAGGALFILDNLQVNVLSLLTGLGVVGIGVAFAAKDTIANVFGSVTVFLDRPFQVGDAVVVSGVEGTVEEVGFRSTRVRTYYDSVVSVPNAKLVDSTVDNMGRRRFRRFRTVLGIRYDTPALVIEAFCEGVRGIVRANPRMRQDTAHVYLNDWGASSLNILVVVFFEVPDFGAELRERQNFMLEVIRLAERLGVGFAFPTTTLQVESTPEHPLPAPRARPAGELDSMQREFGPGGAAARPAGTPEFAPAPPAAPPGPKP